MTGHIHKKKSNQKYYPIIYLGTEYLTGKKKNKWGHGWIRKKDADAELRSMLKEFDEGVNFFNSSDTFNEAYEMWLENVAPEKYCKQNIVTAKGYINKHIIPVFGSAKLDRIETKHIQRLFTVMRVTKWIEDKEDPGNKIPVDSSPSDATKKKIYGFLKSIFASAKDWGFYSGNNPTEGIVLKTPKIVEHEVWNDKQIYYFLNIKEVRESIYLLAFEILATTGMRRGEVSALQWKDFDGKGLVLSRAIDIYNNITDMKTSSSHRRIALMDFVIEDLDLQSKKQDRIRNMMAFPTLNDFIITDEFNKPINPSRLSEWFKKFIDNNNTLYVQDPTKAEYLPPIPLKNLRHSFATMAIEDDINIKIVSEMLGHSKTSTTQNFYQGKIKANIQEGAVIQLQNKLFGKGIEKGIEKSKKA